MSTAEPDGRRAFLEARDFALRHRTDYDTAVRHFRWPQLSTFNWALDYFDAIADANTAPALHIVHESGGEERRSFAEMSTRSNQVANFLRDRGVRRGDRVLVMLGNEAALWETMLAAIKIGAILSPASALLTTDDLQDRIDRGQIGHVIAGVHHTAKFDAVQGRFTRIAVGRDVEGWTPYADSAHAAASFAADAPTNATDPLLLYFTSGTTAKPKMVVHTHQSYPIGHLSTMYYAGVRPGDRHWNISSPGWAKHAWSCFFTPWNAEATVFIYNYDRFNAARVLRALATHQVTTFCAPPTVWRMLVQEPLEHYSVSLREALSAGEPLNPEVIDRVQAAWNLAIRDGYGQTETTALVGNSPGHPVRAGSMGRPLIGYDIVLLDANGNPSDEGEICIDVAGAPLGLTTGYGGSGIEDVSLETADGYYHTGDVARRDADGYFTFIGRADDVFKASDYRISPFELESALIEHAAIAEAAVVPSPDPIRHTVPKAFVVLAAGHQPSALLAREILTFARTTLAPYKRIRRIEFADLPKTVSGKIRRVELRALEAQRRRRGERGPHEYFEEDFVASS
jgi:acetyl-CoA synthetase